MKKILLSFILLIATIAMSKAQLLVEDFDYGASSGNLTTITSNWVAHSGTSGYVQYVTSGLEMGGYGSETNIGGSATISTSGAEDINRTFAFPANGNVYYSMLMNISAAGGGTYFIHYKNSSTTYYGRLFAKDNAGNLQFGINNGSTATYHTANYEYNKTYLIVVKLNIDNGNLDLFVLDNPTLTEPTPTLSVAGSAAITGVVALAFRQASGGPSAVIDGLRITTDWATLLSGYPIVSQIATNPTAPSSSDAVHVSADVVDNGTISSVVCKWGTTGGSYPNTITMATTKGVYTTNTPIPAQTSGTTVYYVVEATDDGSHVSTTDESSYTIPAAGTLSLTAPVGGENFYVGDTITATWTSTGMDSVYIYVYDYDNAVYFPVSDNGKAILASLGSYDIAIPVDAFIDTTRLLITSYDSVYTDESGDFYLIDTIRPQFTSLSPDNSATNISNILSTATIEFNEIVFPNSGFVYLKKTSDNSVLESFDVTNSSDITVNDYQMTMNISVPLLNNTSYYFEMDEGIVADIAGNTFEGIIGNSVWSFTTIEQDLFISEWIEGFNDGSIINRAMEIYNPTSEVKHLSDYVLWGESNGSTGWEYVYAFPAGDTILPNETYVIVENDASAELLAFADWISDGFEVSFTGNDARALCRIYPSDTILIDIVGNPYISNSVNDTIAGVPNGLTNHTVVRKSHITSGNSNWWLSAGTDSISSEWLLYGEDDFSFIGWHINSPTVPVISNVQNIPAYPIIGETVTVQAEIDFGMNLLDTAIVYWGLDTNVDNSIGMINTSGMSFEANSDIPSQTIGTTVYYKVFAQNNLMLSDSSDLMSYTVSAPVTITLTAPLGGESYYIGDTIDVTWTSSNIDSVNVYAYAYNWGQYFKINESGIDASLGMYSIPLGEDASVDSILIRITSALDTTKFDESGVIYIIDTIAPVVDELIPADDATNIAINSYLTVEFSELVEKNTGNIVIKELSSGNVFETIDINSANVLNNYNTLVIVPSQNFEISTSYYVEMDAGIVIDVQNNPFEGISGTTTWNFTTTSVQGDLFISEYIEGSSNNKAIELYNPTGSAIDLSAYTLKLGSNGAAWGNTLNLTGNLNSGDVYVVAHASADPLILAQADETSDVCYFNGNDALGLFKNGVLIDAFGLYMNAPATGWDVAGVTEATKDHTLVRKPNIVQGNTDWTASAGTNASNSEWIVYDQDDFTYIGWHNAQPSGIQISNVAITPSNPTDADPVNVSAQIVDVAKDIVDAKLFWGLSSTTLDNEIAMSLTTNDIFTSDAAIPAQTGGTQVFYMVWAENTAGDTDSTNVMSYTVSTSGMVSIYDIQYTTDPNGISPYEGQVITTSGIVTGVRSNKNFYIQDGVGAWNGILVFQTTNTVAIGDSVLVTAEVDEYNGLTDLTAVSDVTIVTSANELPLAEVILTGDMDEMYEGVLIKVENAIANSIDGSTWSVYNGTTDDSLAVYNGAFNVSYTPEIEHVYNITGIGHWYNGASIYELLPRTNDDIVDITSVQEVSNFVASIYPNPVKSNLNIELKNQSQYKVRVYSLIGNLVYESVFEGTSMSIKVDELTSGMYQIEITDLINKEVSTSKIIVE